LQGIGLAIAAARMEGCCCAGLLAYQPTTRTGPGKRGNGSIKLGFPLGFVRRMRAGIDPAFLAAQPPRRPANAAHQDDDNSKGSPSLLFCASSARIAMSDNLAPAFRKAEQVAGRACSAIIRFACRFLASASTGPIIDHGEPGGHRTHTARLRRTDRSGAGLSTPALALEARGMWSELTAPWQDFHQGGRRTSRGLAGESAKRVQALIWARMAENTGPAAQTPGPPRQSLSRSLWRAGCSAETQCREVLTRMPSSLPPTDSESYRALFELVIGSATR